MNATTTLLDTALEYLGRGWSVIPLQGKIPRVHWADYKTRLPTEAEVRAWWMQWPDAGIGVALGKVSNLIRIDADGGGAAVELERLGGLPETLSFTTPVGGRGWLLRYQEGLATEVLWKGEGQHQELRVQSDKAYTVLPPSPHPAGGVYEWVNEGAEPAAIKCGTWLCDRAVERMLQDLVKELRPTLREPDRDDVLAALEHVDPDEYDTWIKVGMALKAGGYDREIWVDWSKSSGKFQEGECERKWASFNSQLGGLTARSIIYWARQNGFRSPNHLEQLDDVGCSRVLARVGAGKFKHSSEWGWLAWDGQRWVKGGDAEKKVAELQKSLLDARLKQAIKSLTKHLESSDEGDAEKYRDRTKALHNTIAKIKQLRDNRHIRGTMQLAESDALITVDSALFDKNPWLLNCPNGTLDLKTGELKPHDPADLLTQMCPTEYDPAATCPRWLQFLQEVFDANGELIGWVQKYLGYCCTGVVREHVLALWYGSKRNGKSTLARVMYKFVLGPDYGCSLPSSFFAATKNEQHPTKLKVLHGKRFAIDLETDEVMRLNASLLKRLTGGDEVQDRGMYENFAKHDTTSKLVIATNFRPRVPEGDDAVWARLRELPFRVCFEGREEKGLDEKLQSEASGILNWLIEGCRRWDAEGLGNVKAVEEASQENQLENDTVMSFFKECCELAPSTQTAKRTLIGAYQEWCRSERVEPVNDNKFGRALLKHEPSIKKDNRNYIGVKLR